MLLLFFFFIIFVFCQGYELSGEIALKNNHYYYYYYYFEFIPIFTEFRQESVIELCAETTNDNNDDVTVISESPTMYFLT